MRYLSTRGGASAAGFSDILLGGLMDDGGLAIPDAYPQISRAELTAWRKLNYRALAFEILRRYADDIAATDLSAIIARTYTQDVFNSDDITPVSQLQDGVYLLALPFRFGIAEFPQLRKRRGVAALATSANRR